MPISAAIKDLVPEVRTWRRELHQNPELMYDVEETAKFVAERLRAFGCDEVKTAIGRTGVVGVVRGSKGPSSRSIRLRADHAGHKRIPPEIAAELAEHTGEDELSSRELDVLRLIAAGNANKEIAGQLFIAEETVKNHVSNILAKLHAKDRTHAVTTALKRGIIQI
jgi:DNA-binding NarL/FixJ family response regulator